jgi:hypothetical protein
MKKTPLLLLSVVVLFLVGFSAQLLFADDDPGKKVFMDNKCSTCHSVDSQQIKKTMASSKAPDLSNVGSTRTEEWITKWLKKEEAIDGKKHPKTWTGKDEDLTTLVKWLGTLKKA